jgi:hypothetical protein
VHFLMFKLTILTYCKQLRTGEHVFAVKEKVPISHEP